MDLGLFMRVGGQVCARVGLMRKITSTESYLRTLIEIYLIASSVIKNVFSDCMIYSQMAGQEMVNSLPCVAPAKAPPARQHVQGESLQSITSSLQSTACFVALCPVGNLERSPLFSTASRALTRLNIKNAES